MTRAIVVTGCDANHFELATDLLTSLRDQCGRDLTIGFIHVGDDPLPAEIADMADHVVNVPDSTFPADQMRGFRLAYLMVKPRIPKFFPGYDMYVWLDGDTWVQNAVGLEQVVRAAGYADISMHPERDPSYDSEDRPRGYLYQVYESLYGTEQAQYYSNHASFNAGVFGARSDSPVWALWEQALAEIRDRTAGQPGTLFSDQIPIHRLVVSGRVSVMPLRAVNNWLTTLRIPAISRERRRLLVPTYPFEEINIVHLIGATKDATYHLGEGGESVTLRYRDMRSLVHPAR